MAASPQSAVDGAPNRSLAPRTRLESVDTLRGFVMVLMALDHIRDFVTNIKYAPLDLAQTFPALVATRLITHFCAPVFVFLAGSGAFLMKARGKSARDTAMFLITRGLWLFFLEIVVVRFGWFYNWDFSLTLGAVIWAIGCSMVVLAPLSFLPSRAVGVVGVCIVCLHNLLDGIQPEALGSLAWAWKILHQPSPIHMGSGYDFFVGYPLLPWIGIMATGYGAGEVFLLEASRRRRLLRVIGIAMIAAFICLRWTNLYGDAAPWSTQKNGLFTLFSFLNTTKYPPSLLYALMTLGPALIFLSFLTDSAGKLAKPFVVFGRVPLFYYVLHLILYHGMAVVLALVKYGRADWLFRSPGMLFPNAPGNTIPPDYGYGLPAVYLCWIIGILLLYPVCKWFSEVKRRRNDVWLSYL
ncbi:MAG TPA: heparan-alpha-glucosaminide N-acetyltransferase domain-containing protein [Bryobacteraceae bacterium]|nr:heparan-alpha-glucosaminide N-acetyltransferase domain-containing protein [Bryobacteraceae bacterium]